MYNVCSNLFYSEVSKWSIKVDSTLLLIYLDLGLIKESFICISKWKLMRLLWLDLDFCIQKSGLLDGRGFALMARSYSDSDVPEKSQIPEKVTESFSGSCYEVTL